jgi:hypothetical protein
VNGTLSLAEARTHYTQCGAAHPRFLPYVRMPQSRSSSAQLGRTGVPTDRSMLLGWRSAQLGTGVPFPMPPCA